MLNLITSTFRTFFKTDTLTVEDVAAAIGFNESVPEEKATFKDTHPFIHYLKGRLVDVVDADGGRWTGHVAMYYHDSGKIRIDWDNGATTYHQLGIDSMWVFKLAKKE